jgi:hypothetical protein
MIRKNIWLLVIFIIVVILIFFLIISLYLPKSNESTIINLDKNEFLPGEIINFYIKTKSCTCGKPYSILDENRNYIQFEVSTNNGATWEPQCGMYTAEGNSLQGINGQPMYDGVQNEWILEQIDLNDYLGESISVRLQFVSDSGTTRDGFYFDDFKIFAIDQSTLSTDSPEKMTIKVYPNPVKDNLTLVLPSAIETSIKIYAISGQLIKNTKTSLISTEFNLENLSQGVYILKYENTQGTGVYKIIKE